MRSAPLDEPADKCLSDLELELELSSFAFLLGRQCTPAIECRYRISLSCIAQFTLLMLLLLLLLICASCYGTLIRFDSVPTPEDLVSAAAAAKRVLILYNYSLPYRAWESEDRRLHESAGKEKLEESLKKPNLEPTSVQRTCSSWTRGTPHSPIQPLIVHLILV
jgi:hypothetical protein